MCQIPYNLAWIMETFSKAAAARRLGVTRQTIHRWLGDGAIYAGKDGRIPQSELSRLARVPMPEGFTRRRQTVTFLDKRGTQCQVSIHNGRLMLAPIGEDRAELTRDLAAQLSRVLSAYATTGKFPPHDR